MVPLAPVAAILVMEREPKGVKEGQGDKEKKKEKKSERGGGGEKRREREEKVGKKAMPSRINNCLSSFIKWD